MSDPRQKTESRRKVLKLIGGTSLLVPIVALTGCSGDKAPATPAAAPKKEPAATKEPEMVVKPVTQKPADMPADKPAASGATARLSEDDRQAKSLSYVHDATKVVAAEQPRYKAGQICGNCALYQGGDEWGGCSIFPGRQVNVAGWCSVYAPKVG